MPIAYGSPRLPSVPQFLIYYEIAFATPSSSCSIFQHAVHPASPRQTVLDSDTEPRLHVCEHSDPRHCQERNDYRMPFNVFRRLVIGVYKRRNEATVTVPSGVYAKRAGQPFVPRVGYSEL